MITANIENFTENDFVPFAAGIEAGAHFVLVNHNIVKCIDESNPSSLSAAVHKKLREELKFTGIIVTDDMDMEGVNAYLEDEYSACVAAVLAGNDMVMISDPGKAVDDIKKAVDDGKIDEEIINHSVMRILAWKYAKGMIK